MCVVSVQCEAPPHRMLKVMYFYTWQDRCTRSPHSRTHFHRCTLDAQRTPHNGNIPGAQQNEPLRASLDHFYHPRMGLCC